MPRFINKEKQRGKMAAYYQVNLEKKNNLKAINLNFNF